MKWFVSLLLCYSFSAQASFAPPNNLLVFETTDAEAMRVTKANFDRAIWLVENAYTKEIEASGRVLQINNLWSDPEVNAYAYQVRRYGQTYLMIDALGGLARYGHMSTAAYVGVLCHELGHHLGGAPRSGWASVEGQSDYWGFQHCMLRVYSKASTRLAGQRLSEVLADLGDERKPSPYTPDKTQVTRTLVGHPNAQCRLDTMLAAIVGLPRPRCWYKP